MKQEYTQRMKAYDTKEYQLFLKEKCVLDAYQFLHSSGLYLNYALITKQMYEDVIKSNFAQNDGALFDFTVEILGFHYDVYKVLNKMALEWISHISNAVDCLLQYINAALDLRLERAEVTKSTIKEKLRKKHGQTWAALNTLQADSTVSYIRDAYNYSKHTINLYGGSDFFAAFEKKRYINFPAFRHKKKAHPPKSISELFDYYENFIKLYLDVLDSVNTELTNTSPTKDRFHIGTLIIDGHPCGISDLALQTDIALYSSTDSTTGRVKQNWLQDMCLSDGEYIEIFSPVYKTSGQCMNYYKSIDVVNNGVLVGYLCANEPETSTLSYYKYQYHSKSE